MNRTAPFDFPAESELQRLGYGAGPNAAGADLDTTHRTIVHSLNLLQVGIPGGTRLVVGMADIVTGAGAFAADFTFS